MKINMNIPDELMSQVDDMSKELYINRTSFFIMSLNSYISSLKFQSLMGDLSAALQRLGTQGNNDEETIKEMEKFIFMIKSIQGE